ncbi:hypothetical protein HDV02_004417, partial [Globomyces sp. JEL0801]
DIMEDTFIQKLYSTDPRLILRLILLNSTQGPWFNYSLHSIEDDQAIELKITGIDINQKIINFRMINQKCELYRNESLDRLERCLKAQVCLKEHGWDPKQVSKNQLMMLVAPDTPLNLLSNQIQHDFNQQQFVDSILYNDSREGFANDGNHLIDMAVGSRNEDLPYLKMDYPISTLTTFDMQIDYQILEFKQSINSQKCLMFQPKTFKCSFSYYFKLLDNHKYTHYGNYSVHSQEKKDRLIRKAQQIGFTFRDEYWNFDIVLHWLTMGVEDGLNDILEFLIEYEKTVGEGLVKQSKDRVYRIN